MFSKENALNNVFFPRKRAAQQKLSTSGFLYLLEQDLMSLRLSLCFYDLYIRVMSWKRNDFKRQTVNIHS